MTTTITSSQESELEPDGSEIKASAASSTADQDTKANGKARIWWEKTVEYRYALSYLRDYKMICPLDGNFERAGDVILRREARWCLIEFKRYEPTVTEKLASGVINIETKKFKGTKDAQTMLKSHLLLDPPGFHHIVHGIPADDGMDLAAHDYWDCAVPRQADLLLKDEFTCGEDAFYRYVSLFMKAKGGKSSDPGENGGGGGGDGGDGDGGSPSGGGTPGPGDADFDFTNVLALTHDGKEILCCPLREFYALLASSRPAPPTPDKGDGGGGVNPNRPSDKGGGGRELVLPELVIDLRIPIPTPSWDGIGIAVPSPEM